METTLEGRFLEAAILRTVADLGGFQRFPLKPPFAATL